MDSVKTIKLAKPIRLHDKEIGELVFKAPTGNQYLDIGEPRNLVKTKDGSLYWVENDAIIKDYVHACVQGDDGPVVLELIGLADARRAKEAILSFFTDADQATSEK